MVHDRTAALVKQIVFHCVIGQVAVGLQAHFSMMRVRYVLTVLMLSDRATPISDTVAPRRQAQEDLELAVRQFRMQCGIRIAVE